MMSRAEKERAVPDSKEARVRRPLKRNFLRADDGTRIRDGYLGKVPEALR
jgi:hypothetical protein